MSKREVHHSLGFERLSAATARRADRVTTASGNTDVTGAADAAAVKNQWCTQRRRYQQLLRSKRTQYWLGMVETNQGSPKELWKTFDQLTASPIRISMSMKFGRFFEDKVAGIRASTAGASSPTFMDCPAGINMGQFAAVTANDVIKCIHRLPDKTSAADRCRPAG
jgi:hypothetical protein